MSDILTNDALYEMVWQYADRFMTDGKRYLTTMGISALEHAFKALGWDDPHHVTDEFTGYAVAGCEEWTRGAQIWEGLYLLLCGPHLIQAFKRRPLPEIKLGRGRKV